MALEVNNQDSSSAPVAGLFVTEGAVEEVERRGVDRSVIDAATFEGKAGQVFSTRAGDSQLIAIGLGAQGEVTVDAVRRASAQFVRSAGGFSSANLSLDAAGLGLDADAAAQGVSEGLLLGSYKYTEFKSAPTPPKLETVSVPGASAKGLEDGKVIAEAVYMARDLINGPPSHSTPRRIAQVAQEVADRHGLAIRVLDEGEIEREGLGGLLGVSRGSDEPPRLIELTYEPEGGADKAIALVGKGITFDSGGLSLKPAAGMMTMKTDMSGAAAVLGAMSTVTTVKPAVKVVGIICATENLPGPKATKPGDVLKARNGKTMEVLNTDAEGRLVLADGLSLAVEAGVDAIVDVATLTGACVVALGNEFAGLMTNNDEFGQVVRSAADRAGENVWPLPLPKQYRKHIDSEIADIKNIGAAGGAAGALSAGLFLKEFVGETPWVHLDIAGPARSESDDAYIAKGGTAFGTRTLVELVRRYS